MESGEVEVRSWLIKWLSNVQQSLGLLRLEVAFVEVGGWIC